MLNLFLLIAALQLTLLLALACYGFCIRRKKVKERLQYEGIVPDIWPRVALFVPVAGNRPQIQDALESLLLQDYPCFEPYFVTATNDEPAAGKIRSLQARYQQVRHIVAGQSLQCGQKNHNLLKGLEAAGAKDFDIYVFCDSSHIAPSHFLKSLVCPLVQEKFEFSTGYHLVRPEDEFPATLGYAFLVLVMRLLQACAPLTQLWGGAMAMTRQAYEKYHVAELWQSNVVDDCSLTAFLQSQGIPVQQCASALLETKVAGYAFPVFWQWLERQILFLKFCMPGQWAGLGVAASVLLLPLVWSLLIFVGGFFNLGSSQFTVTAACWLLGFVIVGAVFRNHVERSIALPNWIIGCVVAMVLFMVVYLKNVFTKTLLWNGLRYTVGTGGRVLGRETE